MLEPLGAGDHRAQLSFGPGVELVDTLGSEPVDPGFFEPGRTGFGQVPHHPESREVVGRPQFLREVPDALHHGGDEVYDVGPVFGHGRQGRFGIEAGKDDDVAPVQQGETGPDDRPVVKERTGHHEAAVPAEQKGGFRRGVDETGVPRHDQLRTSGRSSRRGGLPGGADHVLEVDRSRRFGGLEAEREAHTVGEDLGIDADDDHGISQRHHRFQLAPRESGADRLGCGAQLPGGGGGHEPFHGVGQCHRHHVADADAEPTEFGGQSFGTPIQFEPAQGGPTTGDRRRLGFLRCEIAELSGERDQVGHRSPMGSGSGQPGRKAAPADRAPPLGEHP